MFPETKSMETLRFEWFVHDSKTNKIQISKNRAEISSDIIRPPSTARSNLVVLGNEDNYVDVSTLMLKITNYH